MTIKAIITRIITQINHDVFVSEEEHARTWIVQLVPLTENHDKKH
jgi:hypothetical protein